MSFILAVWFAITLIIGLSYGLAAIYIGQSREKGTLYLAGLLGTAALYAVVLAIALIVATIRGAGADNRDITILWLVSDIITLPPAVLFLLFLRGRISEEWLLRLFPALKRDESEQGDRA